jgi:formylglycine-generating enzyme required for sulfatase activity/pimeloyl-ACP methyl ester carboxylesterase
MKMRGTTPRMLMATGFLAVLCLAALLLLLPIRAQEPAVPAADGERGVPYPAPGKLVDVGGYKLHLNATGAGKPTVVLIAGGGDYSFDWSLVQSGVSRFVQVCSYDRAGMAWSDLGPTPRTMKQDAFELHQLLKNAGILPPYVLVGHSVGGLIVRAYADQYPEDVAAGVLIDSTHEDTTLLLQGKLVRVREAAKGRPIPPVQTMKSSPPKPPTPEDLEQTELNQRLFGPPKTVPPFDKLPANVQKMHLWFRSNQKLSAAADDFWAEELQAMYAARAKSECPLGDKPLVVMIPSRKELGSPPPGVAAEVWKQVMDEKRQQKIGMTKLSRNSKLIVSERSGHHIQLDDPELVVEAIRQAVEAARQGSKLTATDQADPAKEIDKLKEEMRQLKAQLDELRAQNKSIVNHLTFAPGMEAQTEDYVQARARFQTKLLRKGPSPQGWTPTKPPEGVSEVEFPSGELHLKAWVNRPADEGRKYPAVLYLHGGFSFDLGDWNQTKPYRDAGFVVLTPILRAENGQPGAFSYFYDEVDDVLAAGEYLSKQPYVDASRLFVAGHSVGGTMTLLAAMASKRFRAAASFDGACYRPEFVTRGKTVPFDSSDPREIQLRSPMAYASSFKCPLRIYHGTESADFFRLMSLHTTALAKRRGLDVETVEIEGNHATHVPRAMMQSIAFFQRISSQEIAPWKGEIATLPKTLELDLSDGIKMKLARIEPGRFQMGSPPSEAERRDDELQHEVEITKPYCLGVYVVTQAQFRQVMGMRPSFFSPKRAGRDKISGLNTDDFPVENVSWEEAMDFCRVVSLLPGVRDKGWVVDLPTEAEWEYACRAGTNTTFHVGNSLSSGQANCNGENPYGDAAKGPNLQRTTKVGSYEANAWGLYDMHGNVLQWCKDWYDKNYQNRDKIDTLERVARGGFWLSNAKGCRAARRHPVESTARASGLGFRVVVRLREKTPY